MTPDERARFEKLEAALKARPAKPVELPGVTLKEAAVLAPLFVRAGEPHLLFTRRPARLRRHPGQIAFPGGGREEGDPTPLHTALRETHEELGIAPEQVRVLGMLDETPTITQFRIIPFVGVIPSGLRYAPNPDEVDEVLEVPLSALRDPANVRVEKYHALGQEHDVYFYDYGPHVIWGATARIVRDLMQVMSELPGL